MKKMTALLLACLLVALPSLSTAGKPVARMIPMGEVSLLSGGEEVRQFRSEVPLPDGLLMVGEGRCVIQSNGLQLIVQENAVFSLEEQASQWNLKVKQGHIDFAMRPDAKPVTFRTPHEVIQTRQAVAKASSDGLIKGFVAVTEAETQLGLLEGTMHVSAPSGSRVIEAGKGIALAMASPPGAGAPVAKPAGPPGGTAGGTGGSTGTFGGTGLTWTSIGVGLGVTTGIVVGAVVAGTQTGSKEGSPF